MSVRLCSWVGMPTQPLVTYLNLFVQTSPPHQLGKAPAAKCVSVPREGQGRGGRRVCLPLQTLFLDDPLQDIMCKLCYYVYG